MHPPERGTLSCPLLSGRGPETVPGWVRRRTMPEDLKTASTGSNDLYFADDLEGTEFRLRGAAVWSAEEVREAEGGTVPEFGRWLPATVDGRDVWLVAVGELIQELQRFDNPESTVFDITRCQKSGTAQTDPYEVNVEPVSDVKQTGLPGT